MNKRERVEDLGRIAERLNELLDNDIFNHCGCMFKGFKDFLENCQDEDRCEELYLQIERLNEEIGDLYQIARWGDDEDDEDAVW